MILLDTSVISELFKANPDPKLTAWANAYLDDSAYIPVQVVGELMAAADLMMDQEKEDQLRAQLDALLTTFATRILPYDLAATREYATLLALSHKSGRPTPTVDLQIAALGKSQKATLATRNPRDFDHLGIATVNPFV
ncbi:MAG: PIN domain-containing protein [Actinomycetaceae bacterium]|nr:PIN domain-containing protein [Actinomycetaceae bacterium]